MVLCKSEHAQAVDKTVFPGLQGGPLMHVIAGKAVCFAEALEPEFKDYARVIIDKRELAATMRGYPVARATSRGGSWVYTLYYRQDAQPFIHALDAAHADAVCIDLNWKPRTDNIWGARLELTNSGRELLVRDASGVAVTRVDTETLHVR